MCLWPQISQPKLSQIAHVGGVLKTSGPADSKYTPGFENWPRFVGVIEQNKISDSFDKYCIIIFHMYCTCVNTYKHSNNTKVHSKVNLYFDRMLIKQLIKKI